MLRTCLAPGLIGTAPSKELLDIWNEREAKLVADGPNALTLGAHLHTRPLALLPEPKGALLGKVQPGTPEWERIAKEAARTIPGSATYPLAAFHCVTMCHGRRAQGLISHG
jgi:hypothetical protein